MRIYLSPKQAQMVIEAVAVHFPQDKDRDAIVENTKNALELQHKKKKERKK